jgi:hypothetical protein
LAELFGTPVSEDTVPAMTRRAAEGLEEFLDEVEDRIATSHVAGFEETGPRVTGTLHWSIAPAPASHRDHLPPQA